MRQQVVAIVEDDPSMLRSIERLLKAHKFQIAAFTSAEAFLDGAASSAIKCLVLDIDLPGMSGIELRCRLTASGSEVPVIFISAIDNETVRDMAIQSGCLAFLSKPFLGSALIAAINEAAAG